MLPLFLFHNGIGMETPMPICCSRSPARSCEKYGPTVKAGYLRNPWRNLFGAAGLRTLLQQLRANYDLVILDCPPALANADGAMMARLADKCVLVAAWDETPISVVRNAMRSLMRASPDETGLYVNRVPAGYRFGRLRGD